MFSEFIDMLTNGNYFGVHISLQIGQRTQRVLCIPNRRRSHPENLGSSTRGKDLEIFA